jgi:ribosomal protein S6--L-glutamate ligase
MILSFHSCFLADTQVILGDGTLDDHDRRHIEAADVIILPQTCPLELYQACKKSSALLFPNYDTRFEYLGKTGQSRLFKELGLPHPKTEPWPSVKALRNKDSKGGNLPCQMPFVIKADKTHEAEGVYIIEDAATLESALQAMERLEDSGFSGFVSQEWIETEGNVLRVVIMGRSLRSYWKRAESSGEKIAAISRGAKIDENWRHDLQEKGKTQAQRLFTATGINLAAIDFVFPFSHHNPEPLFLEVNYSFGRQGLGGSRNFFLLLFTVLQEWLVEKGFDPNLVTLL